MKVLFVGCGNMGQAIINGMLASKSFVSENIDVVLSPSSVNAKTLRSKFSVNVYLKPPIESYDIIIFAVKPQVIGEIIESYSRIYDSQKNCIIISIIAGKTISFFKEYFPQHNIVRTMPNLNCQVLMGSTVGNASDSLKPSAIKLVEKIFNCCGSYTWIDEKLIDVISAISGSGPAYYFLFTESLAKAAIHLGIEDRLANKLACETFFGAATIAANSGTSLRELRQAVTSFKGTTEAAISVFEQNSHLTDLISSAMAAAIKRAEQLK